MCQDLVSQTQAKKKQAKKRSTNQKSKQKKIDMKKQLSSYIILKNLLKFENISQRKLSQMTNIPEYKISKYCRGEQILDFVDAYTIASFFNITMDQLFGYDNYFNWFIYNYSRASNLFNIKDQRMFGIIQALVERQEVFLFDSKKYEAVIGIDLFSKKIQLKNRTVKLEDYGKEWTTIIYD